MCAPTQHLAKRAIRAPGWVPGPHPGEALGDCQCPVSGIDRDRQTWHTASAGVTTDHALWPNRRHNRQSGAGMNRVTGVDSSDDHFVTEEEPSRSTTCFTFVPKSLNSLQVLDSTTH